MPALPPLLQAAAFRLPPSPQPAPLHMASTELHVKSEGKKHCNARKGPIEPLKPAREFLCRSRCMDGEINLFQVESAGAPSNLHRDSSHRSRASVSHFFLQVNLEKVHIQGDCI